ncbi:MAG: hypothetical protein ISS31_02935 [Kiritimatiellae bacterium]|nr:hypothetical protein [Kiritimatiellia bacterium]
MKRFTLLGQVLMVCGFCTLVQADTVFEGGYVFDGNNWDNGLPSIAKGNGTVAVAGTHSTGYDFNESQAGTVIVSHTAGNITDQSDWTISNSQVGGATYVWNQSGGMVQGGTIGVGDRVIYTLSGGNISGSLAGAHIQPVNSGVFAQTGGTTWNLGFEAGNGTTLELSGGSATDVHWPVTLTYALWAHGSSASTISISGDHICQIADDMSAANVIVLADSATLVFAPAWLGFWTRPNFSAADWETAVTNTGVKVGATQVTAGNFGTLFTVIDAGTADSTLRLASAPGTYYRSGDMTLAASWDNGLPAVGNDGQIMFDGTFGASLDLNDSTAGTIAVTHAKGTFTPTASNWEVQNSGSAPCEWTQSGGQVTAFLFMPNSNVDYTLAGDGVLQASAVGTGARVELLNTGTFTQTGGTLIDFSLWNNNGATVELVGGQWSNAGAGTATCISGSGASSIIRIGGDFTVTSTYSGVGVDGLVALTEGAQLIFAADWKGSWTLDSRTRAQWVQELDDAGVKVGATPVTDANFDTLFVLTNDGEVGSTIRRPPAGTLITIR